MAGPNVQTPGVEMFNVIRDDNGNVTDLRMRTEWATFFASVGQVIYSGSRAGSTSALPTSDMLRWVGMQTFDVDEQSPAWLKTASTNTWIYPQIIGNDLILPNAQTYGIKVDEDTPVYPWHDLLGAISIRGVGASDPSYNVYRGGIRGYQFDAGEEVFIEFHLPHDYVSGSDLYIHFHWSFNGTNTAGVAAGTINGGTLTWGAECTYSKGHNQAAFAAPVTRTVDSTFTTDFPATTYQHIITETQLSAASPAASQLDSDNIEVDGMILCRAYLSATTITVDSGQVPDPFLHFVDIHYQSTGVGTKNKSPNFWT